MRGYSDSPFRKPLYTHTPNLPYPNPPMYRVQLEDFEGPLDLLLFFIKRDELDIYDIPIARITDEFLSYVRLLSDIDLDGVGDFIFMAALLINIKVRMLLPRPELDEEGEPIDPRRELVERLLEYIRYKEAAADLTVIHEERGQHFVRGVASQQKTLFEETQPETLVNTTLFDLVSALRRVLTEATEEPVHEVGQREYSISEQRDFVLELLAEKGKQTFVQVARQHSKAFIIATFLAILEMAREGSVVLSRTEAADDFYITPGDPPSATDPIPTNGTLQQNRTSPHGHA